jgi:hypothetical protein
MSTDVKISYVNNSINPDEPTIFIFTKNEIPTFDVLKDGVAWRTLNDIGNGSSTCVVYPVTSYVQAMWGTCNKTQMLSATIGKRYTVEKDSTGIVITETGQASQPNAIEVSSLVNVEGGIRAQLVKDGSVLMEKKIVAYGQKTTFILHPKLYWGIASEIQEGQAIRSAGLNTENFFVQDIEGVTNATVTLTGNPNEGYKFVVENHD